MGNVVWMRPPGSRIAHAFRAADLAASREATALRWCGTWPVAELERDDLAERCRVCAHAADRDTP